MKFSEGKIEFEVSTDVSPVKLDEQSKSQPEGMCLVDYVVDLPDVLWLIEVKDFPPDRPQERKEFEDGYRGTINGNWVPKARDSYTFLHLMKRDNKPMGYIVLLEGIDSGLFPVLREHLRNRLDKETDQPWERRYIKDCYVLNIKQANEYLGRFGFRVSRKP